MLIDQPGVCSVADGAVGDLAASGDPGRTIGGVAAAADCAIGSDGAAGSCFGLGATILDSDAAHANFTPRLMMAS